MINPNYDGKSGPEKAIDGNKNTNWHQGSCTGTKADETNPWWLADLAQNPYIYRTTLSAEIS